MDMKNNTFYLANTFFDARVNRGRLCSVKKINDRLKTEYASDEGFGDLSILYEKGEELREFFPNKQETFEDCKPTIKGGLLAYCGHASDQSILVETEYLLNNEKLEYKIRIRNISEGMILLRDVGISQVCQSSVKWGEDASKNVIGHHYVGGTGSYSTYYRVDGDGPCLFFAPSEGTELTWYDVYSSYFRDGEKEKNVGRTILFPFASKRAERAIAEGAKIRINQKSIRLDKNEDVTMNFVYFWAEHFLKTEDSMMANKIPIVKSIPGYTVTFDTDVRLAVKSSSDAIYLADIDQSTEIRFISENKGYRIFSVQFRTLGEHSLTLRYEDGKYMELYYFVTEAISTLWKKRAAFIADKQLKDEDKWCKELFCEYNNETGALLYPGSYDKIRGWRIYEVSCDDPGLSKPAFLSSKQTVWPDQKEILALDKYIEAFVWGGLQRTEKETYSYGIYGIPDWKQLRESDREDVNGKLHIWRIYDYPHIALMYYNMYYVGKHYPHINLKLSKEEYLLRAYNTACAMFTIPLELEDWSAYKTGLYNERVIPYIIMSLREEGMSQESDRLEIFWNRKVKFFVTECKDVFGSEYPFDTTGFESTFYLAEDGIELASLTVNNDYFSDDIPLNQAISFMEKQHSCNIACRGYLEPAYFWYGSDYRGNNMHYLLSYMSQMGGCSILEHALYYESNPYKMIRLGYGSLMSSYALMNTGTAESNYGYWFKGKDKDGAAGGGFEVQYETETWLNQPSHGGSWYYSCEIDMGFCGGIRGASVIFVEDPLFGVYAYGGNLKEDNEGLRIQCQDGAGKKFHYIDKENRVHVLMNNGSFNSECMAYIKESRDSIVLYLQRGMSSNISAEIETKEGSYITVKGKKRKYYNQKQTFIIDDDDGEILIELREE